MMFMLFVWILSITLIFKLLTNVRIQKWDFLSFYVLSFNDFVKTGIFSLSTCTETFLFKFRFYAGMLISFSYFLILCCCFFSLQHSQLIKEHLIL